MNPEFTTMQKTFVQCYLPQVRRKTTERTVKMSDELVGAFDDLIRDLIHKSLYIFNRPFRASDVQRGILGVEECNTHNFSLAKVTLGLVGELACALGARLPNESEKIFDLTGRVFNLLNSTPGLKDQGDYVTVTQSIPDEVFETVANWIIELEVEALDLIQFEDTARKDTYLSWGAAAMTASAQLAVGVVVKDILSLRCGSLAAWREPPEIPPFMFPLQPITVIDRAA